MDFWTLLVLVTYAVVIEKLHLKQLLEAICMSSRNPASLGEVNTCIDFKQ